MPRNKIEIPEGFCPPDAFNMSYILGSLLTMRNTTSFYIAVNNFLKKELFNETETLESFYKKANSVNLKIYSITQYNFYSAVLDNICENKIKEACHELNELVAMFIKNIDLDLSLYKFYPLMPFSTFISQVLDIEKGKFHISINEHLYREELRNNRKEKNGEKED